MDENLELSWGTVPAVIIDLARLLASRASDNARRIERMKWPDGPGDVQEELRLAIGAAHKTTKASNDVRALLSAYAHKFHNPRPVISDLARAQETSARLHPALLRGDGGCCRVAPVAEARHRAHHARVPIYLDYTKARSREYL